MTDSRDSGLVVYAIEQDSTFFKKLWRIFAGFVQKLKALFVLCLWFAIWFLTVGSLSSILWSAMAKTLIVTDGTVAATRWIFCLLVALSIPVFLAVTIYLLRRLLPTIHQALLPSGNYGQGSFLESLQTEVQTNAEQGEVPLAHFFIDDLFAEVDFSLSNFIGATALFIAVYGLVFAHYIVNIEPLGLSLFLGVTMLTLATLLWMTELAGNVDALTATSSHVLTLIYGALLWYLFPQFVKPLTLLFLPILVIETFLLLRRLYEMTKRRLLVLTTRGMRFVPLKLALFPYPHLKPASAGEVMPVASITARPGPWGERWRMNFTFGAFEEVCPVFVRARMVAQIAGAAGMEIIIKEMRQAEKEGRGFLGLILRLFWSLSLIAMVASTSHFWLTFHTDFEPQLGELLRQPTRYEKPLSSAMTHHPFSMVFHTAMANAQVQKGELGKAHIALQPINELLDILPQVFKRFDSHKMWSYYRKTNAYVSLHGRDGSVKAEGWEPTGKALPLFRKSLILLCGSDGSLNKLKKGRSLLYKSSRLEPKAAGPLFVRAFLLQQQSTEDTDGASVAEVISLAQGAFEQARSILVTLKKDEDWQSAAKSVSNSPAIPRAEALFFALLRQYLDEEKLPSLNKALQIASSKTKSLTAQMSTLRLLAANPPKGSSELLSVLSSQTNEWPYSLKQLQGLKGNEIKQWFGNTLRNLQCKNLPTDIQQRIEQDPAAFWLRKYR